LDKHQEKDISAFFPPRERAIPQMLSSWMYMAMGYDDIILLPPPTKPGQLSPPITLFFFLLNPFTSLKMALRFFFETLIFL